MIAADADGGMGVISMKLVGEETFDPEDRKAAMRFCVSGVGCGLRDGGLQEYGGD